MEMEQHSTGAESFYEDGTVFYVGGMYVLLRWNSTGTVLYMGGSRGIHVF